MLLSILLSILCSSRFSRLFAPALVMTSVMTSSDSSSAPDPAAAALLTPEFWEARYQAGSPRWDLGQPAPPLANWLASSAVPVPGRASSQGSGQVLVLGSGMGHEALLFAQAGFAVTAVDFAPSAISATAQAARQLGLPLRLLERNLFNLLPELAGQFDYVVEHTCFCAIDPALRSAYVELVAGLLKPGGLLIGLFFTHGRPGGPPFGTTPAELRQRFEPYFTVLSLAIALDSVASRQGEEHLALLQLKPERL
jgi:methyl halide transferase